MFAFDGIADGACQGMTLDLPLDQVILRAGMHGLNGKHLISQSRQYQDGEVRNRQAHPLDGVQVPAIRQ